MNIKYPICLSFLLLLKSALLLAQPIADFTANRTSGCSPVTVQFTSTSTGTITSYLWNFGNGNTSTLQNPSAIYVTPGTYTVTLTVSNGTITNTKSVTAYITIYQSPTANFVGTPLSGCAPLVVSFSDLSTSGSGTINNWLWDFGNGVTSTAKNPTVTYASPGTYTVSLVIRDANNCSHSITKTAYITVAPPFTADFSAVNRTACNPPLTVNFTHTVSPAGSYTYAWNFGDGGTSTAANPSHTYTSPGSFTVTLVITSSGGCKQTITKPNYVQIGGSVPDFDMNASGLCAPANINLVNRTTPSTGNTYNWTITGQPAQTSMNANFTALTPGSYTITLRVVTSAGCSSSVTKTISFAQKPDASFVASRTQFCEPPALVNFTNTSSNGATWNWNFGNGVGSSAMNPSVTYLSNGVFKPRLIVTSALGTNCKDTATETITIRKPSVNIIKQHLKSGCVPFTTKIEAIDNNAPDVNDWEWQLNGAIISDDPDFFYTFNDTGVFVLKLTAKNDTNCFVVLYDTVKVGQSLNVNFEADKLTGCYNQTSIKFTPNWVGAKPESIYWEIGLYKKSSEFSPTIEFNDTIGLFTIKMFAIYKGCTTMVQKSNYINIFAPIAKFKYTIDTCRTDTATFYNLSTGKNKFSWDFGDSNYSSIANPINGYAKPGKYTIRLIALDTTSGCQDTADLPITIIAKPIVSFLPNDTAGCSLLQVRFRDQSKLDSTRTITNWFYKVIPGNASYSVRNPLIQFSLGGDYGVKLQITDNYGCKYSYTDSQVVHVYKGSASFNVSPNKGCIPYITTVRDTAKSENGIRSRKWLWGNGDSTQVTDSFASYTYNAPNTVNQGAGFTIRLVATDSLGCEFTTTKSVLPSKPIPNFTQSVIKTCGRDSFNLAATINNGSTYLPGSVLWRLPEGKSSISFVPSFSITGDTTIPVKLIVTDFNGCKDSITKMMKVNTKPPVIDFIATPNSIPCYKSNTKILFADNTVLGGSKIKSRRWTFGDGTFADSLPNPEKLYLKPGMYDVSLSVTDSAGCAGTKTEPRFIAVGGPIGSFDFNAKRGCAPHEVWFEVNSPNARLFIWDHADGNVDTFEVDTHGYTYNAPGVYYPRLTLVDSSLACDFGYDAIDSIVVLPLPMPNFEANKTLLCKDNSVIFTNNTSNHPTPILNWKWILGNGDTVSGFGPINYQYQTEGLFDVSLQATDTNGCRGLTTLLSYIQVTNDTIAPPIPSIKRATVLNNTEVLMEYEPVSAFDFDKYIIYHQNTSTQKKSIVDTSFIEQGLNTLEFPYSYQMAAVDVCNNQSALSELHRTVELKTVPRANAIELNWTAYAGFDNDKIYEIWRKTPSESNFSLLTTLPGDSLFYLDTSLLCYAYYTYQIKTIEQVGSAQFSWSDTSGASPIYTNNLPTPRNIRATVSNNQYARLEWHLETHNRPFEYQIYKAIDDGLPVFYKSIPQSDTVLVDTDVDVQKHAYSYITYTVDQCGGLSQPSNMAKTILLKVKMEGNDRLTHDPKLNWNAYTKWENGVNHYNTFFYDDMQSSPQIIARNQENELTTTHQNNTTVQENYCYLTTAYQQGDTSIISESNIVCVSTEPRMFAPNVFTINGDGLNDVFYVKGLFIETFLLKIYDRWGKLIYQSANINNGWDGTNNGELCASDVYVYLAEATGKRGEKITITGNVSLLR